ncbi:MAG: ABC transporter permease [Clostridiales bacterium]|nr:ABC transporter permease [Clostridiales bacterium]
MEKEKKEKKLDARTVAALAPYIGLVAVIVIFEIITKGALLSVTNLQSLSSQVIVTALATIGAVFVFGAGYFDMSLSGCICFAAVIGGEVAIATGSLVASALATLGTALAFGLIKGIFAATVNVPFFIFTIVLGSVISAVVLVMLGSESTIYLSDAVKEIPTLSFTQMSVVNVICLVAFFVACVVLFNYTSIGIRAKNMGGNIISAKQSGIDTKKTTIIVFLINAVGVAIAAYLIMLRTRTVGGTTASSVGNDVMVALVLGGMPLSGGPKSKISAGLLGAATITLLNSGLTIMGLTTGQVQVCRGIVFIVVVLVSSLSYRGKLLPR